MKRKDYETKKKRAEVPKMAAAIRYEAATSDAPRLTAKGKGVVAEKIVELARRNDIPVREDKALVQILSRLDIDQQIPPELYRAVAEILAFVYSANEQYREKQGTGYRVQGQTLLTALPSNSVNHFCSTPSSLKERKTRQRCLRAIFSLSGQYYPPVIPGPVSPSVRRFAKEKAVSHDYK